MVLLYFKLLYPPGNADTHACTHTLHISEETTFISKRSFFARIIVTFSRYAHARAHQTTATMFSKNNPRQTDSSRAGRSHFDVRQRRRSDAPGKLVRKKGDASPSHLLSLPLSIAFSLTLTLLSLSLSPPDSQPLLKEEDEDENSECVLPLCRCSSTSANCPSFPGWCTRNTSFLSSARR